MKINKSLFGVALSIGLGHGVVARGDEPPHGPPPIPAEAFQACDGRTEGASCEVQFRGETLSGTCVPAPANAGKRLMCRPKTLPPPPGR